MIKDVSPCLNHNQHCDQEAMNINILSQKMVADIVEKETQAVSRADSMLATICCNEHDLEASSHGNNAIMYET